MAAGGADSPVDGGEGKAPQRKREQKAQDKLDDGKSGISSLADKKSGGKPLDKHCPLCKFKFIPGANWSRHCKSFHEGTSVEAIKCCANCLHCNGK